MLTYSVGLSEDRQQIKEESFNLGKKPCWRKGVKGFMMLRVAGSGLRVKSENKKNAQLVTRNFRD
jgi:hypothetical protein